MYQHNKRKLYVNCMATREDIERNKKEFKPGSESAVALGCRCPADKNCNGAGYGGDKNTWVIETDCTLHYWDSMRAIRKKSKKSEEDE